MGNELASRLRRGPAAPARPGKEAAQKGLGGTGYAGTYLDGCARMDRSVPFLCEFSPDDGGFFPVGGLESLFGWLSRQGALG